MQLMATAYPLIDAYHWHAPRPEGEGQGGRAHYHPCHPKVDNGIGHAADGAFRLDLPRVWIADGGNNGCEMIYYTGERCEERIITLADRWNRWHAEGRDDRVVADQRRIIQRRHHLHHLIAFRAAFVNARFRAAQVERSGSNENVAAPDTLGWFAATTALADQLLVADRVIDDFVATLDGDEWETPHPLAFRLAEKQQEEQR